jgi:hypothetical protein
MIMLSTDVCFFQIVFILIVASIIVGVAIQFRKDEAESDITSQNKSEALDILKKNKVSK